MVEIDNQETIDLFARSSGVRQIANYKIIDLFAGIGGIRQGFTKNGCEVVFSSEIDHYACQTYVYNYKDVPKGDITKIESKSIPDFDILCAGFPCQPFSQAGYRKGFKDTRGTLFFEIARILKDKKPKAFFLENVRHLLKHDNGNTFSVIKNTLQELGYSFFYQIIKASDYGLPQHRARLYMVGVLNDKLNDFYFPGKIPLKYNMSDILGGECSREIGFTLRVGGRGSPITDRRNWEHYYVDGKVVRINEEHGKKLQGFDEKFFFPVSNRQAMKQLGNSVAIDCVFHIAKSLITYMEKQNEG